MAWGLEAPIFGYDVSARFPSAPQQTAELNTRAFSLKSPK